MLSNINERITNLEFHTSAMMMGARMTDTPWDSIEPSPLGRMVGRRKMDRRLSYVDVSELPTEECCVCYDKTINTRIEPCKHIALCHMCALKLIHCCCPLCRAPITHIVNLILKQQISNRGYLLFSKSKRDEVRMELEVSDELVMVTDAVVEKKIGQLWTNLSKRQKHFWDNKIREFGVNCGF